MSFICDKLSELLNFMVSFVKTMFSVDALENDGRTQENRGPGGRGIAAPRANNVHTLFDNNALAETEGHGGGVHLINSNLAWQTRVNEAKTTRKVMAVDFFATWCAPCKMIAPVFVELSRKIGQQLLFAKVDIDEVPDVAAEYGVVSMPTFLFIRDGQEIDRIVGADRKELQRKCNQYANR